VPPTLKFPLTVPEVAERDPTVIFGVPLKPVALPVTFPTKPLDAVATPVITIPPGFACALISLPDLRDDASMPVNALPSP
jgi:hypothetical protein